MINNRDVTIFNRRLTSTRLEALMPTAISGVSCSPVVVNSNGNQGEKQESVKCIIRIPRDAKIQGNKTFVNNSDYAKMSDSEAAKHWTIRPGDYFICKKINGNKAVTLSDYKGEYFTIVACADNTLRGTKQVQHYRIEGA